MNYHERPFTGRCGSIYNPIQIASNKKSHQRCHTLASSYSYSYPSLVHSRKYATHKTNKPFSKSRKSLAIQALSTWLPTTDCCNRTWQGVLCDTDTQTYRVDYLFLTDLNLSKPTPIAPSIGNLPYLNILFIGSSNLHTTPNLVGPIPSSIAKLTKLRYLYITHTNVSGPIPDFLSRMKSLLTIDFSYNNLSGTLPPSLSSLPNLGGIGFDGNRISGAIPDSYGEFSYQFTVMTLSRNRLTGMIPATLAKMNLSFADLSRNMLEGDASVLFGSDKNTDRINLAKNLFAFDLGKVGLSEHLDNLDIRNNRIYGKLPKGLTGLNLCGEIPQGGRLQRFDVYSYNRILNRLCYS